MIVYVFFLLFIYWFFLHLTGILQMAAEYTYK